MPAKKYNSYKVILTVIGILVVAMGVLLFFIPPALFPDPANGFQVLRSMQMGSAFNTLTAPDQSDIAQNYTEYITWWSPGQYLVPYFFKLLANINTGQAMSVTVAIAQLSGLAGLYCFFKKIGFSPLVSALSIVFIFCQLAFFVPYVYYNGGEVLLFSFEGWFLYGCVAFKKADWKLLLFVLLSGWVGFFFKSSFLWMYGAGLFCLWVRLSYARSGFSAWIKKGLWIGLPAMLSMISIYLLFLSKGESPATASKGFKLTSEAFSFPLSTPILSGFSVDDFFNGLLYHFGKPVISHQWAIILLLTLALLSVLIVLSILRRVPNDEYRLFVIVFYLGALLFFGMAYLQQLNISYEARHFRIIGLLIAPGMIYLIVRLRRGYRVAFTLICIGIAVFSFRYLVKGYFINADMGARGITGISQINIDQPSLDKIIKLDRENRNATFVFIANDISLEIKHNRVINLPPIGEDYRIDVDDYRYDGFAGPLFIVLPETYAGPREKMIMKSFPDYAGFNISMLSNNYRLYTAKMKRQSFAKK
ncbi:MAG TPA: hypothetical protein VHA56_11725 [Mucilaginibacter sp.]|nr:hypothetical protein [Mucilaginibacter sp.]